MNRRMLASAAIGFSACLFPVPANAAPTVIVGPMTIEGGTHTFTEQIIVTPGATLTVKDATIWLDVPRSCPIGGTITVCNPSLFVMPGGTLITDGATFDTHLPVVIDPPSGGYMVYTYSGVLSIDNTTFLHANTVGGEFPGPTRSTVTDSTFIESLYPITFIRGSEAFIQNNTIVASRQGIHVRDADAVIRGNTVSVGGNGIDVQATLVGAMSDQLTTRALVEDNIVTGGLRGFFTLNAYRSTVRNNVFSGAVVGATLGVLSGDDIPSDEVTVFEDNRVEDNETAMFSYTNVHGGQEEPIEVVVPVHNNSITGTTCQSVFVNNDGDGNVSLVVDASNNWWGSPDGPQDNGPTCPAVLGDAIVEPWLTTPPALD